MPRGLDTLGFRQPGWSRLRNFGPEFLRPACFSYASMDATSGASMPTWLELTSVRQPLPGCPGLQKDSQLNRARCFTRPPCNLDALPPSSVIRSKPVRPRWSNARSLTHFSEEIKRSVSYFFVLRPPRRRGGTLAAQKAFGGKSAAAPIFTENRQRAQRALGISTRVPNKSPALFARHFRTSQKYRTRELRARSFFSRSFEYAFRSSVQRFRHRCRCLKNF